MAKNGAKVVQVRAPKSKTPAQKLRSEQNKRFAAERLERLQGKQKLANAARKAGFFGSDDVVITKHAEAMLVTAAGQYCHFALNECGDASKIIRSWLKDSITLEPLYLKQKIVNFLARPKNVDIKTFIDNILQNRKVA